MSTLTLLADGATHQLYAALLDLAARVPAARGDASAARDRGAVSLEQVLWFAAAGISVAVIATILWNRIVDESEAPITPPQAPTGNGG